MFNLLHLISFSTYKLETNSLLRRFTTPKIAEHTEMPLSWEVDVKWVRQSRTVCNTPLKQSSTNPALVILSVSIPKNYENNSIRHIIKNYWSNSYEPLSQESTIRLGHGIRILESIRRHSGMKTWQRPHRSRIVSA